MSSIEAGIHQHWSMYKPLDDLVPSARVFTGTAKGEPVFPYVTLERQGDSERQRTSGGIILEAAQIRFHVWADDLDEGKTVVAAIESYFNRRSFEWVDGAVLDCKPTNHIEFQEETGTWHVIADYTVRARFG